MAVTVPIDATIILNALTSDSTQIAGADVNLLVDQRFILDFWGQLDDITLTTASTGTPMNSLTLPSISNVTIEEAYIMLRWNSVNETSGASNRLDQTQHIQVKESVSGTYTTGLSLYANYLAVSANAKQHTGNCYIGHIDVSSEIDAFGDTYAFQWAQARCLGNNIYLYGVQTGIRLICKVA